MCYTAIMKIATYNIRNLFDPGTFIDETKTDPVQEDFFTTRVNYFIEQLRSLDLDIVCLQEIGGELGIARIAEALDYAHFSAKPNARGIRVAVLYKKTLTEVVCKSVSLGELVLPSLCASGDTKALPPIEQRRDLLVLECSVGGMKTRIISFHLKSLIPMYLEGEDKEQDTHAHADAKFRSIFYKMMELRAIRQYANTSIGEGYELVLLGDFNEDNHSSIIDILRSSVLDTYRLTDVMVRHEGNKTTHIHRGNTLTFDTILVTEKLLAKLTRVGVENQTLRDYSLLPWGAIEHEVESDHALVWMKVEG